MSEPGYDSGESVGAQELRVSVTMLAIQSRMARAAIGWGVRELAAAAKVSPDTIARLERGETLYPRTVEAIRTALEAAGVEFIPENGGGVGVRLRKP
jgi:transcriptional regulator with XRE-family HTH domain